MSLQQVRLSRRVVLAALATTALASCAPAAPPPAPTPPAAAPPPPTAPPQPAAATKPAASPAAAKPAAAPTKPAATAKPATQGPPKPTQIIKWKHLEPNALLESAFRGMAFEKGYYKDYNLDVEIVYVSAGGNAIIAALTAGEADSGEMGPAPVISSTPKGGTSKLIGAFMPGNSYAIFGPSSAKSLDDLKGKAIASGAPGALSYELLHAMVEAKGYKLSDFVQRTISGTAATAQALVAGAAEAGVTGVEFLSELEKANVKPVVWAHEVIPDYVRLSIAASERAMREKADALQWFLVAHTRGHRYALDHRDETLKLGSKVTGKDQEMWIVDWYIDNKVINPNVELTPKQLEFMLDLYVKQGTLAEKVPVDRIYDGRWAKGVNEILGPYQPGKST